MSQFYFMNKGTNVKQPAQSQQHSTVW